VTVFVHRDLVERQPGAVSFQFGLLGRCSLGWR